MGGFRRDKETGAQARLAVALVTGCLAACASDLRMEGSAATAAGDAQSARFQVGGNGTDANADGGAGDAAGAPDAVKPNDGLTAAADDAPPGALADASAGGDGKSIPGGGKDAAVCSGNLYCATNVECPQTACAKGVCSGGCCIVAPVPDGQPCDDGDGCTTAEHCEKGECGAPKPACDDGIACTDDSCNPATGKCSFVVSIGWCLINGKCVGEGAASQSTPCKTCDPSQSSDSWTVAADCCGSDADCPAGGPCDKPACDPILHKCGFAKPFGCCTADAECSDGNACTKDSCDLATGACSYAPVSCVDPTPCQTATCNPATGECKATVKAGWCMVAGACHGEGDASPTNPCLVCASAKSQGGWTSAVGTLCSDGNPCTFGDACSAAGKCQGQPQQGCCQTNADCGGSADPCTALVCDAAQGLCVPKALAGCCTSGTCCDVPAKLVKVAKAACGGGPIATEYQCSGQEIQKREISAGCDGSGANACSTAQQWQSVGPWNTIKLCGSGTQCKQVGSGQMPTCESTQPAGSCKGSCGAKSTTGTCWCDSACSGLGDCCADFMTTCGCSAGECCDVAQKFPKTKGTPCGEVKTQFQCAGQQIQKRTGQGACDGANACATASADVKWSSWLTTQTCASGTNCVLASGATSASCVKAPAGSCVGHCGVKSAGSCYCDTACKSLGDCCADFDKVGCATVQTCGAKAADSCKGKCGNQATSGCWCDTACDTFGDCCADKVVCSCQ